MPSDNVDSLTNDKEVHNDDVKINNWLPKDVCGTVQVQTKILNGEDHSDEKQDDNDAKEEQTEPRAGKMRTWIIESWIKKIFPKNQFLEWRIKNSKSIVYIKNYIVNNLKIVSNFIVKHPHDIFGQYINDELKNKFYRKQRDNLEFLKKQILYQEKHYNLRQCSRFRNTNFSIAS